MIKKIRHRELQPLEYAFIKEMNLPHFRYHPDSVRSGSIRESDVECICCGQNRGAVYIGPTFCEADIEDALCPWCIADGSAHRKFDATFVDGNGIEDGAPASSVEEITCRTPGYSTWQSHEWPVCCSDATIFRMPAGISEIRSNFYELEGLIMMHIVQNMEISGGAARRMLESLDRDKGPTVHVFECVHCAQKHFRMDML